MSEEPQLPPKKQIQFGLRTLLEIITVAAFVLALIYGKASRSGADRYQFQVVPKAGLLELYVLDGHTGKTWRCTTDPATGSPLWMPQAGPPPEF